MIRHSLTVLCIIALGSCSTTERLCPAFGAPLTDEWSTALNVGDRVNFVSDRGTSVSLELTEREDSEPFTGTSRNGSDNVTCRTTSDRIYEFDNSDLALRVMQRHNPTDDPALLASELFTVQIQPESPIGESVIRTFDYVFFLGLSSRSRYEEEFVLGIDTETGPQADRFIRDLQIGNNLYPYSVEIKFADVTLFTDVGIDPSEFKAITRMIMAEGAGLVQFEMLNGEIFSRI